MIILVKKFNKNPFKDNFFMQTGSLRLLFLPLGISAFLVLALLVS